MATDQHDLVRTLAADDLADDVGGLDVGLETRFHLQSHAHLPAAVDDPVNALLLLLHAISDRWTDKQHETFVTYRRHGTEVATAAALGVSQPTVHQSLAGAMAKPYAEAYEALLAFAGGVEP